MQNVISNWSGVLTITCGQMNPQLPDYKDLIPDNPLPNDYAEAEEYITTMSSKAGSVKSVGIIVGFSYIIYIYSKCYDGQLRVIKGHRSITAKFIIMGKNLDYIPLLT